MKKSITAGKFAMVCITCLLLDSYEPLEPYRRATIVIKTIKDQALVDEYSTRLGIELSEQ